VQRTWDENRLFAALVELTYGCNVDCAICYNDPRPGARPLSIDDYLRLFADLKEMQVLNLTFSGGEPLVHRGFFRLGAAARELGFVLRIKSNGMALTAPIAKRIKRELQPILVEISLHGATAATHDRQTRVPGSFDRLLANLRAARAAGLRVSLSTPLTAWNEGEVEQMAALAADLGTKVRFDLDVTPRDDGDHAPLAVAPTRQGIGAVLRRELPVLPAGAPACDGAAPASGKYCGAGSSTIAVDPWGVVFPCVQWRHPIGNLQRQRIHEIWAGSQELARVRSLTAAAQRMLDEHGASAAVTRFCPGVAAAVSGDPVSLYPAAVLRQRVYEELGRDDEAAAGPGDDCPATGA
jgi:mycofactocin biosynthetic radical S-adenosylmethionine protein MftC